LIFNIIQKNIGENKMSGTIQDALNLLDQLEKDYIKGFEIKGLKIKKYHLADRCALPGGVMFSIPKYRFINYSAFLCKIVIATDDMGTQICYNGAFFGGFGFSNIEEAADYLKNNKEKAIKFFRKVYLHSLKYKFSIRHLEHLYWRIRHHFDPTFYCNHWRRIK
jgi:hypothetical protein